MNTVAVIIIIILSLLLAAATWLAERQHGRAVAAEKDLAEQARQLDLAQRDEAEERRKRKVAEEEWDREARFHQQSAALRVQEHKELSRLRTELSRCRPGPAHFVLKGGMTEEEIADRLAGLEGTEPIKAILAHIGARVVALADRATDAPRAPIVTPERIIAGYSAEERLHDAGGADHLAQLLARLEELVKPREEEGEKPAASTAE